MLIYVAGKYSGNTRNEVNLNIDAAIKIAGRLWKMGHAVICPHANSAHFDDVFPEVTWEQYIAGDLNMIARVDAMVMVPGWEESNGARTEWEYALQLDIPIYYAPDLPTLHPTEVNSPIQCKAFREEVGIMYRTHLSKNADYSPANILVTGQVGLVTRLWDKVARFVNLTGYTVSVIDNTTIAEILFYKMARLLWMGGIYIKMTMARTGILKTPKHESIDDSLRDMSVYAVIGLLLRTDRWGK